jgi:hypothetical protein
MGRRIIMVCQKDATLSQCGTLLSVACKISGAAEKNYAAILLLFRAKETKSGSVAMTLLVLVLWFAVWGASGQGQQQQGVKVEAILDEYVVGGGSNGNDQIKMHYANETLAAMPQLMAVRVHELSTLYCGQLTSDLALFAVEHGSAFGLTNETKPGFDVYDVAHRVLMALETVDGFPVPSEAITTCRDSVSKNHAATSKRQHPLWIVACMAERQEKERETRTGDDVFRRWTAHVDASSAMEALGQLLRCPQQMTRLAAHQIDVEYRRDALRKAAAAGKLSEERLEAALAKLPMPRRVDYQRLLVAVRNATLSQR